MIEAEYQDMFLKLLRRNNAYATSIVGSMYQSGQPDITCTSKYGVVSFIELKMWRRMTVPTADGLISLLRGPQVNVIVHQLWEKRKAPCWLVANISGTNKVCFITHDKTPLVDTTENLALWFATRQ